MATMQLALSNSISQINGEKHIVVFLDITQLHNMHNHHIFAQGEWFIYYKDVKQTTDFTTIYYYSQPPIIQLNIAIINNNNYY